MTKVSAEIEDRMRSSVTFEMDEKRHKVEIGVKNIVKDRLQSQGMIDVPVSTFMGLVTPILKEAGYNIILDLEVI